MCKYNTKEVWKDIEGFEGRYQVSNFGRVKSFVGTSNISGMFLKFSEVDGYSRVHLTDSNGKRRGFLVHRLVGTAFIPNTQDKPEINHIDSNRKNNFYENLEWVTSQENSVHSWKYGGRVMTEEHKKKISKTRIENGVSKGENNPMYGKKFSEEHRQKISDALKGKHKGKNNPMYGKRGRGTSIGVATILPNGDRREYLSISEASDMTGIDNSYLTKMLKKNKNGFFSERTGITYYRIEEKEDEDE